MTRQKEIHKLFEDFQNIHALVIGDVMVDAYLYGKVERISPEAPVPVVSLQRRVNMLGGAANVALNLKALGANPILFSVIGEDPKGIEFLDLMKTEKLETEGIMKSAGRVTTAKFRIIGNKNQMLRVDEEMVSDLQADMESQLLEKIKTTLESRKINVIIFQDYDKGVITGNVIRGVFEMAAERNIPVAVDPKRKNFSTYRNARLFKPNLKELRDGLKTDFQSSDKKALEESIKLLQANAGHQMVMVTLGEEGIVVRYRTDGHHLFHAQPAHIRNISDVSGAGDTVISVASLCLALDVDPQLMTFLANLAGGIVCEYVGVVPVDKHRLMKEAIELAGKTVG